MTEDATKKRWQRAHQRTRESLEDWGPVLALRPGQVVDYESPSAGIYVRVCLDAIPNSTLRELEKFRSGQKDRRVFVHLYGPGDARPKSIEIFSR